MLAASTQNSVTLNTLQKQVGREILSCVARQGLPRTVSEDASLHFDSSLIWWVANGSAAVEYKDKVLLTLCEGDIIGPWFAALDPLHLGVSGAQPCELIGFRQDTIWKIASSTPPKMRLWSQFQTAMCSRFFEVFAALQTSSVAPAPQYRHYAPGETIILEGQVGNEVFVLTDGTARVSVRGDQVGEIHRDEVFGALAALTEGVRTATVVATEPCDCMVFPKDEFRELLRTNPRLLDKLFHDFARALHDLNDSVVRANHTKWHNLF
jgi:hypothetical protein